MKWGINLEPTILGHLMVVKERERKWNQEVDLPSWGMQELQEQPLMYNLIATLIFMLNPFNKLQTILKVLVAKQTPIQVMQFQL